MSDYDKINQSFERAVVLLQQNLQYLTNQGKVSDKFISLQNLVIKSLVNYQHQTEAIIGQLEMDNTELMLAQSKEFQQLLNLKESFEAVCIIHGIMDFPIWMNQGKDYLVSEAVEQYKAGGMTLPIKLQDWINGLPAPQKEALTKLLYKKYDEEIADIERQIQELKQKKKI